MIVWPRRHSRADVHFHAHRLAADEVTDFDGITVTTPARTLLDLASVLDRARLERAVHEAEVKRLTGPLSLEDLVNRHAGTRGAGALRAVLSASASTSLAASSRSGSWPSSTNGDCHGLG